MRYLFKAYRKSYFTLLRCSFHSATHRFKSLSYPLQFALAFVTATSFVLQATSFIALRLPGTLPLR